jgi:hypothetical protein
MGSAETLEIDGRENITVYQAVLGDGTRSEGRRHFCRLCGSALWVSDPSWPELVHPFASAIDTPLPTAPEHTHIMLDSAAPWVEVPHRDMDEHFDGYPDQSIEDWHRSRGLYRS